MAPLNQRALRPFFIYSLLALAIMLPLLWPGYILTLDMVFTPHLPMPEQMSSSYLFHAALHYLNLVVPSQIIEKLLLFIILLLSGMGMFYLVRYIQTSRSDVDEVAVWGAYVGGFFYMVNPFTYSRFMAGQYAVLLGYALLPFFARALLRFLAVPTFERVLVLSMWLTVIGIVSVHTLGLAAVLIVMSGLSYIWRYPKRWILPIVYGLIGLAIFVLASGYWLWPLVKGTSNQGQAVAAFTVNDQTAFATTGDGLVGKLGNVLQLQGFWAETQGMYLLPQDQLPGWGLVLIVFWAICGFGVRWLWRNYRALAVVFCCAGLAALIVAITGTGSAGALAGFREPHKFVGLLAMAYALFAGLGTAAILAWAKRKNYLLASGLTFVLILIPVLLTPTMFWGFAGQLAPRHYPDDWFALNSYLAADSDDFSVLSLPWHGYMHYQFAGRVIANPSEDFFDKPVIASNELEFNGAAPTFPDYTKHLLSELLPHAAQDPNLGDELAALHIKYILLAKTFDYKTYDYLNHRSDFNLTRETEHLKLYRNVAYGQ